MARGVSDGTGCEGSALEPDHVIVRWATHRAPVVHVEVGRVVAAGGGKDRIAAGESGVVRRQPGSRLRETTIAIASGARKVVGLAGERPSAGQGR
jgi:hypothetical protein